MKEHTIFLYVLRWYRGIFQEAARYFLILDMYPLTAFQILALRRQVDSCSM